MAANSAFLAKFQGKTSVVGKDGRVVGPAAGGGSSATPVAAAPAPASARPSAGSKRTGYAKPAPVAPAAAAAPASVRRAPQAAMPSYEPPMDVEDWDDGDAPPDEPVESEGSYGSDDDPGDWQNWVEEPAPKYSVRAAAAPVAPAPAPRRSVPVPAPAPAPAPASAAGQGATAAATTERKRPGLSELIKVVHTEVVPTAQQAPVQQLHVLSPSPIVSDQRSPQYGSNAPPVLMPQPSIPPSSPTGFREMSYLPKPDDSPGARELNEARVQNEDDQLYFSRKARHVEYRPKTLSEYKQKANEDYYELGSLGADLNSDELVAKRANQLRIREFSKQLRSVNQNRIAAAPKPAPKPEPPKSPTARDRAREFAKQVPKPKTKKIPEPAGDNRVQGAPAPLSKMDELEIQHERMRAEAEAIRREFGF